MKIVNLVFVRHAPGEKQYLFQAPPDVEFEAGQKVFVDTMRGECVAEVSMENFLVPEKLADFVTSGCGAYKPLKHVTGLAVPSETYEKQPFKELPF
jgi:hypothetical protein